MRVGTFRGVKQIGLKYEIIVDVKVRTRLAHAWIWMCSLASRAVGEDRALSWARLAYRLASYSVDGGRTWLRFKETP